MSLSNLELAANPTWVTAATFMECHFCSFVSSDLELSRLTAPCPMCKQTGSARYLFPGLFERHYLGWIADSYVRACTRADERKAAVVAEIWEVLGRRHDRLAIQADVPNLQGLVRQSRRRNEEPDKVFDIIRERLSVATNEEARRVCASIALFRETGYEHRQTVELVAALFESLLSALLVRLLVSRKTADAEARKRVETLRRFRDRRKLFEELSGVTLDGAVGDFGVPELYNEWRRISDLRDDTQHGLPLVGSVDDTERAFGLARRAFSLFAFLHNKYCVAPLPLRATQNA